MGKSTVSIEGLSEVKAALANMGPAIRAAVAQAVKESAAEVESTMKRTVPVDTGDLQRGIETKSSGEMTAEVGVFKKELYYAQFVEHGTSSAPAQPFMLPAAEAERRRFPQRVQAAVKKATGK
jgi:HK97 gp10 family phage protein